MTPLGRIERDPQPGNSYRMPNACHAVAGGGCTEAAPSVKREQETVKKRSKRGYGQSGHRPKKDLLKPKNGKRKSETSETEGGKFKEPEGPTKLLKTPFPESE